MIGSRDPWTYLGVCRNCSLQSRTNFWGTGGMDDMATPETADRRDDGISDPLRFRQELIGGYFYWYI